MTAVPALKKRIRRSPGATRALILDATERLMVEEGYAAVGSRRIAQELGLNAATVHYHYPVTDDIFIDLHKRMSERQIEQLKRALSSDDPIRAYWDYQSSGDQTALGVEFVALANHRKSIREKLAQSTDEARATQSDMIKAAFNGFDLNGEILSPLALATILTALGRLIANEERVGIESGHDEIQRVVAWAIDRLSPRQPAAS